MDINYQGIQSDDEQKRLSATARYLISAQRQKIQHRAKSMLNRAGEEIGISA